MDLLLISFIITVFLLFSCAMGLYFKSTNAICKSKKRLDGKTCLVTGGTSGIGLEIALDFARRGARVIVACPFQDEGENAEKKITEESGNNNVKFKFLDLASLDSVHKFAADIIHSEDRLDILMNNAGLGYPANLTEDGLNSVMQVNYFGHFLLTLLLLPLLKKTGTPSNPSRIVNTSSVMHRTAFLDLHNMNYPEPNVLKSLIIYSNSKLCLLLFSLELTKKLSGFNVVIHDADPGTVGTRIYLSAGYILGAPIYLWFYIISKTPFEGSQTPIHAALDDEAGKVSGKYFTDCCMKPCSSAARDIFTARSLWDESVACVKISEAQLNECLK